MNIEYLKRQILEAFATAQGVRKAAGKRQGYEEDDAVEVEDKRKEMQDDGETVRVSKGRGPAKVTRKVSDRVRARRAAQGKPNPMFRTRQVASTELVRGARLALAEKVLEAVDKETAEINKRFFANLPPSAAQKTKKALVKSAKKKGEDFDRIADRQPTEPDEEGK